MRAFFLKRSLREKVLLVFFAGLVLAGWAGRILDRGRSLWVEAHDARGELATQQVWLANARAIDAQAARATQSLDPAKTLNATRLVGELNALAVQTGLNADIGSQRTERTEQFAFHSVQMNIRRTDLASLVRFYTRLSQRSPYIGLEQFSLETDRADAGQLNVSLRIVAVELGP